MTSTIWTRTSWTMRNRPTVALGLALGLALPLAAAAPAAAQSTPAPEATAYIEQTVDEVVAILADKATPLDARLRKIEAVAERRFDFPRMSKLVLGRNRKKLSDEQQSQFTVEFMRHLSVTYGRQIEKYTDEKVEILSSRRDKKGATVKTKLVGGAVDGILVDYRLRESDGQWRIIDVIPEGVSLIQNFRAQIQEIVSAEGADRLIQILREKNERDEQKAQEPTPAT